MNTFIEVALQFAFWREVLIVVAGVGYAGVSAWKKRADSASSSKRAMCPSRVSRPASLVGNAVRFIANGSRHLQERMKKDHD